jgi:hypothetical protein
VVCNTYTLDEAIEVLYKSQSPYGAKWFATVNLGNPVNPQDAATKSQSPYGAKWFATLLP